MKERLEKLRTENKLVVGVYQNKELVNVWENEKTNLLQLTAFLWRKQILKSNIRISYSYNYSDTQTLKVIESYTNYDNSITRTEFIFYNIPTNMGYLDIYKLESEN